MIFTGWVWKNLFWRRFTIRTWVDSFENKDDLNRKEREVCFKKFSKGQRQGLVNLYKEKPILYLREAIDLFFKEFGISFSASHVSCILRQSGLTWKVVKRRAIQLQLNDVFRFCDELAGFNWIPQNLIFLDEVSFDNRSMLRKNGYALKGRRLVFRGEFCRKARSSLLCFLGVDGMVNCYQTEGTFNRTKFAECCRKFALDMDSTMQVFPSRH